MTNTPILITGCQRSGTTLMNLIMDSHPDILSIDENSIDYPDINTYLSSEGLPPFISFKLPRYAPSLSFIKSLKQPRVIWCIRNPIDTVWSMINLQIPIDAANFVSWSAHPKGAHVEILNSYYALKDENKHALEHHMKKFTAILNKSPQQRTRQEAVFLGALCWRIKNELPSLYDSENIDFHNVKYEDLVTTPKVEIKTILDYVGVEWDDDVLRHHDLHDGVSIGNTNNTRPIDNSGVGNGANNLSHQEVNLIMSLCDKTAKKYDYMAT